MSKSTSSQRNLVARIFLGGLLVGSIGGLAQHVSAAWRTYPADSHCMKLSSTSWSCGTNMGSDFLPSALTASEIDFLYSNTAVDTIRGYSCRDSWNLTTSTCGSPYNLVLDSIHTPAVTAQILPEISAMKGGSMFDFRYVTISSTKTTTSIDIKGVYLGGT